MGSPSLRLPVSSLRSCSRMIHRYQVWHSARHHAKLWTLLRDYSVCARSRTNYTSRLTSPRSTISSPSLSRAISSFVDQSSVLDGRTDISNSFQQLLSGCSTPESILANAVPALTQGGVRDAETGSVAVCLVWLQMLHYQALCARTPWLQSNPHITYVQLLLKNDHQRLMAPIYEHEQFAVLREMVRINIERFTDRDLFDVFLALLYLALPHTDELCYRLLVETRRRIPSADMVCLATMSYVMKTFQRNDFQTARLLLGRMREMIAEKDEWTPADLTNLSSAMVNVHVFSTKALLNGVNERVLQCLKDNVDGRYLRDAADIGSYVRMACKSFLLGRGDRDPAREIMRISSRACLPAMDQMDPGNIAEICHALKGARCYEQETAHAFELRSSQLLSGSSPLSVVSNLYYALTKDSPQTSKRTFEAAIYKRLVEDDVDIIILSNLADSFLAVRMVNKDLLGLFQKRVIENADDIIKHVSRYHRIVKLLVRRRFLDREDGLQFYEKVLDCLNQQHGLSLFNISAMACYLLPNANYNLSAAFLDKVLMAIPKWREAELYRFALGLNSMRQPITGQLRTQMSQIQNVLHMAIDRKLDDITSVDRLYQLTLGLVIHNRRRDPSLTDKTMQLYLNFTKSNLSDVSLQKITGVFATMNYYLPELFDDLVDYVVQHRAQLEPTKVLSLLTVLSAVGYRPQRMDELLNILLAVYEQLAQVGNVREMLVTMRDLGSLQVWPEAELGSIFTMEFIEKVDAYMEENPHHRKEIERLMMELNRSVVLDCPQLDVPWFHEPYCRENAIRGESKTPGSYKRFKDDVQRSLEALLGGGQYCQRWVYSPYYHLITLECVLRADGKPVPLAAGLTIRDDWQRVSLLVLHDSDYCYNSKQPIGRQLMRQRHLEIMGYKVVEVPHFEWFSMALSDPSAKVEYLHKKVFN